MGDTKPPLSVPPEKGEEEEEDPTGGICATCGSRASLRCSNCKGAFYCKRECQRQDWKSGHKDVCMAVKVSSNSVVGRYLVATRDFCSGGVIFREDPLVVGPKQISEPVCLSCYKKVDGSYRCSKCSWPLCGVSCESGLDHQSECVIGQEIGSPIQIANFDETNHFYEVVTPLRCLTLKKRSPKKYSHLLDLESHLEERKSSSGFKENKDRVVNMLRNYFMLVNFLPEHMDSSEDNIHKMLGILDTNGLDIPWAGIEIWGLYYTFAMIEHSCIPNVKISFNSKKKLTVKAAVDIKKGDHLSTMYTHILWGTIARREHLKLNKYFMCTCRRCADPTELGSNFSSLRCQSCQLGFVTSAAPLDELADWICSNCNATIPMSRVKEITLQVGDEVDAALTKPTLRNLEALIERNSSTTLHPNHFHLFASKHSLLQLYGRQGNVDEETMRKKEGLCKEFLKICTALDPGMTRLSMYTSVVLYEYHLAIMSRTHQPDGSPPTPQSIRTDIHFAKALLKQCLAIVAESPSNMEEVRLKGAATVNLKELDELESSLP